MEYSSQFEYEYPPESAVRITKCFDYLMSEEAGLRDEADGPQDSRTITVLCEEPTTYIAEGYGTRLYGRRFSASIATTNESNRRRIVRDACVTVDDRTTNFVAELPLNSRATSLDVAALSQWQEMKRQKVLMILSTLLYRVFEVPEA